jgi:hypothetical protein
MTPREWAETVVQGLKARQATVKIGKEAPSPVEIVEAAIRAAVDEAVDETLREAEGGRD